MKADRLSTRTLRSALTLTLLSTLLFLVSALPAGAQCKAPTVFSNRAWGWKTNVTVQVNIDPGYDTNQRNALVAAFTNWNNAKTNTCPAVTFGTPTFNANPIAGPSITGATVDAPRFQVYKQNPPDGSGDRGLTLGADNGTYTLSNWTYLHTSVTLPEALKQLMAHEIGHTMGLGECANCGSTASVMNSPVSGYNDTNGLSTPTSCDLAAVKQFFGCTYEGTNTWNQTVNANGTAWKYMWGGGAAIKQVNATDVSVMIGWRQAGWIPYHSGYPPPTCSNISTTNMVSHGASVTFANGTSFSTANGTLSTKYLYLYGHEYTGTYKGKLTDLGSSASVTFSVAVTGTGSGGCGTVNITLNPATSSVTLK